MTKLKTHPAADLFPMMDAERHQELVDDIQKNGLAQSVILTESGDVLDGRNRLKACDILGIQPKFTTYTGGNPWDYVWSLNGTRRDLVKEQRYLIWRECTENSEALTAKRQAVEDAANRKRAEAAKARDRSAAGEFTSGRTECSTTGTEPPNKKITTDNCIAVLKEYMSIPEPLPMQPKTPEQRVIESRPKENVTRKAAAKLSKTNAGAVQRGDVLRKEAPDLAKKVMTGELKPAAAHREMKQRQVAGKVAALPSDKYSVIYSDPPWKYNDAQAVKGDYGTGTGSALGHYPAMTMTELKALDVQKMSADNCVLFLWATSPLLEDALSLAAAWGFKYKAMFVWDKVKHNMGHYNSVRHELLLICTKGSATPENVKLFDSVQSIERTAHSRKPEEFRDIINTLYPSGKKIEMFRRGDAPNGWSIWGNESV